MTEWTKDQEKKILWKYRFLLSARIIRVVLVLLIIYGTYMTVLTIGYNKTDLSKKLTFQMSLAIDWTQSGLHGEYDHTLSEFSGITPFLTQELNVPILRTIGKDEQVIGNMDIKKRLLTSFSSKEITYFQPSDNHRFGFYLPEDPRTGNSFSLSDRQDELAWEPLEKVHEGTVVDMAFSTDRFYKSEELLKILEQYDLDVLWMPLYAGELKTFEPSYGTTGSGSRTYLSVDTLGLTRAIDMSNDYMSSTILLLDSKLIKENQKIMLENMKKLIDNESKTYREQFLGLRNLEERYNYLKDNGFQVYGAVVTGPVKELLKLKDEPGFRGIQVGEFEYWNWETERSSQ